MAAARSSQVASRTPRAFFFGALIGHRAKGVGLDALGSATVAETVSEYAGRCLADRDGRVASIAADRARTRMHVLSKLGPLDVRTFNRDDVESLRLDEKIEGGELAR